MVNKRRPGRPKNVEAAAELKAAPEVPFEYAPDMPAINDQALGIVKGPMLPRVVEVAPSPEPVALHPVKLRKNYHPFGPFKIQEPEAPSLPGSPMRRRDPAPTELHKVRAGTIIEVPGPEARTLLDKGLADRADALPY